MAVEIKFISIGYLSEDGNFHDDNITRSKYNFFTVDFYTCGQSQFNQIIVMCQLVAMQAVESTVQLTSALCIIDLDTAFGESQRHFSSNSINLQLVFYKHCLFIWNSYNVTSVNKNGTRKYCTIFLLFENGNHSLAPEFVFCASVVRILIHETWIVRRSLS